MYPSSPSSSHSVHFRGGDKLVYECAPTAKMSCANVTLHIEGAKLQLDAALRRHTYLPPSSDGLTNRPKLVLLTAEQDAFANFTRVNEEDFDGLFEIVAAPDVADDSKKLQSFKQSNFNQLPLDARIADTRDLLSNVAMLARNSDGFLVSANTNIGRVAALMSNRPFAVSNLDFWWCVFFSFLLSLSSRPERFPPILGTLLSSFSAIPSVQASACAFRGGAGEKGGML
jgi:hypothetical protein